MTADEAIYLDNAATTRVAPEVREAMAPFENEYFGNAASKYYAIGRKSLQAIEDARGELCTLLGASDPSEILFTSCATESNNWALMSTLHDGRRHHVITSAIEHHAILEPLHYLKETHDIDVTELPVDEFGMVDPESLRATMRDQTSIVSIMHANNEVGTLQRIQDLAEIAHSHGALFHTDACQSVGKIPFNATDLGVDMLSLSAHKFHGPKGIGALYVRKGIRLKPLIRGGGQERGLRGGTSNVPGIVGLGKAAQLVRDRMATDGPRERALVEKLWDGLSTAIPKIRRNGHPDARIPNLLNVCIAGCEGEAILGYMDMHGIMVSSGSACTSGSLDPSHVLLAMGLPAEVAHGSIRISLSREITEAHCDRVLEVMPKVVGQIRSMSPTWNG